ncbi:hypothetical protein A6R68_19152 [Neotoma lepida]|uniref:Lipase maturation factor n=1 Tax=Neotoma lepida TaxID=56216 RepID=A0A1A6HJM2_NEOLE|nr:hypothetical protein A6R68_19152 [Neotoma lepida]
MAFLVHTVQLLRRHRSRQRGQAGWESQLLETGFLGIFLCPLWTLSRLPKHTPTSRVVLWGFRWLIFRIMLGARSTASFTALASVGGIPGYGTGEGRAELRPRQAEGKEVDGGFGGICSGWRSQRPGLTLLIADLMPGTQVTAACPKPPEPYRCGSEQGHSAYSPRLLGGEDSKTVAKPSPY